MAVRFGSAQALADFSSPICQTAGPVPNLAPAPPQPAQKLKTCGGLPGDVMASSTVNQSNIPQAAAGGHRNLISFIFTNRKVRSVPGTAVSAADCTPNGG